MRAEDLRIGNIVKDVFGDQIEIHGVDNIHAFSENHGDIPLHTLKGIPITEEWLVEFCFKLVVKQGNQGEFRLYQLNEITYNTNYGWFWRHYLTVQPKYIHELQNLYFALTREELKIK